MAFEDFLNHRLVIERWTAGAADDYGQPARTYATLATVQGRIRPLRVDERPLVSQAGVVTSDHVVYLTFRDIGEPDRIVHDAALCSETADLPTATYEITGVRNPAGIGHHLELDVRLVGEAA